MSHLDEIGGYALDERGCDSCGSRVESPNEFDGLCHACAGRVETPAETLLFAKLRARMEGEAICLYVQHPECFEWTPDDIYRMAKRAAHNARLALAPLTLSNVPGIPVRCDRCGRVRGDVEPLEWRDHPGRLPGEVGGTCRTCAELLQRLADDRWASDGRRLLQQRRLGYGPAPAGEDEFRGFREDK